MAITPKNPGVVSPPNSLTSQAEGSIGNPNVLTSQAEGSIGNPNSLTSQAEGSIGNPNSLTAQAVGDIGNPNSLTAQAVGDVGNPNALTAQAIGSVGNPNALSTQPVAAFPRTLCPVVSLDFENEVYSLAGSPKVLSDLVTYSRASSATFINRYRDQQDRWKYFLDTDHVDAVTNLLTYSEDFSNAAWVKTGVSASIGKLTEDGSTGEHRAAMTITVASSVKITLSVDAQANGRNHLTMRDNNLANSRAWFNLQSGIVGTTQSGVTDASIKYLGDNWYRCSITLTTASTTSIPLFGAANADNSFSYTGDGVSGILVRKAQLTQSSKPLPYVKTISTSASQAFTASPRLEYDPVTGERGYLVEGSSTNLLIRSEEFDNASWVKTRSSITANAVIAPDLTKSADKLIEDSTASSTHTLIQAATTAASTSYTYSVYCKAGERTKIQLANTTLGNVTAYFDLISGEVGTVAAGATASMSEIASGWHRCSITFNSGAGGGQNFVLYMTNNTENVSYTGDGTSGVYVWGAQLEALPFATSYTRTEGSTVSRSADTSSLSSSVIPVSNATIHSEQKRSDGTSGQFVYNHTGSTGAIYHVAQAGGVSPLYRYGTVSEVYSVNPPDGEFYTTTMVRSGSSVTAYSGYSSSVETTVDAGAFVANPSNNFEIGRSGGGSYLFGHIKELKIYDVALTAQEVSLL